jgi:hypothetical protein
VRHVLHLFLLALSFATHAANAQSLAQLPDYAHALKIHSTIQPHGDSPFGERINLYTGGVSFHHDDIVVEGIGPTIRLVRETAPLPKPGHAPPAFGDWQLSVPRIVAAAGDGRVVNQQPHPSKTYASQVVIDHGNGVYTQSAHLDSTSVEPGDTVKAGQEIGTVGTSGNTPKQGDPHLHFEVRSGSSAPRVSGGTVIDPMKVLPPPPPPPPPEKDVQPRLEGDGDEGLSEYLLRCMPLLWPLRHAREMAQSVVARI